MKKISQLLAFCIIGTSVLWGASAEKTAKSHPEFFPDVRYAFPTLIADPRQVTCAVGLRWDDHAMKDECAPVAIGNTMPVVEWRGVKIGGCHGDLQLSLSAGVWAIFAAVEKRAELINADWTAQLPLVYKLKNWIFRLRYYHTSSHLGDEFMEQHPGVKRLNPSFEALDLCALYDFNHILRVYGGIGRIMRSNSTFRLKPLYFTLGTEVRAWGHTISKRHYYMQPVLGVNVRLAETHHFIPEVNCMLGIEWSNDRQEGRKLRTLLEYYTGQCEEGQFGKQATHYTALTVSYDY